MKVHHNGNKGILPQTNVICQSYIREYIKPAGQFDMDATWKLLICIEIQSSLLKALGYGEKIFPALEHSIG